MRSALIMPAVLAGASLSCLALAVTTLDEVLPLVILTAVGVAGFALARVSNHSIWFTVFNGAALAVLIWSLGERVPIQITARGDRIQARAGGDLVQARDSRYTSGPLALWLAGSDRSRPDLARPTGLERNGWLDALLGSPYAGFRSGVRDIVLEGVNGLNRSSAQVWQGETAALTSLADVAASDFTLTMDLIRPSTPASVRFRLSDTLEGYQVLARPETRDLSIERVREDRLLQDLENRGSPFRPDVWAALQSVVRELGRTWLFALLFIALIGFGAAVIPTGRPNLAGALALWRRTESSALARGLLMLTLSAGALIATGWIALAVFEGIPHERDSVAYIFQARMFAHGDITAPTPDIPEAFKEEFIVNYHGRWFGKYPPGHPLALAIGVLVGAPWGVGPALAAVSVALLVALGSRLFGFGIGLISGVLLLTSPFFLFMSGSYLAHTTSLALTMGALLLTSGLSSKSWLRASLMLGATLGALLCTRQLTGAALGVCLGMWLVLDPRITLRQRIIRCALLVAGALPFVALLLCFQWVTSGNPLTSPQTLWQEFDRIGFGPGIGPDGAHDAASGLHDTWDRLTELERHLFGWPFYLTLAPAMATFILGRAKRSDWWLLSIVVAIISAYVLYWARGMAYGPRYFYEALGPLCLLTARGFQSLASLSRPAGWRLGCLTGHVTAKDAAASAPIAGIVTACLGTALVAFNIVLYMPDQLDAFRGYLGVDGRRLALVRQSGLQRGLVFVREEPRNAWQPYASLFWLNSPMLDAPVIFARDRGEVENAKLRAVYADRPAYLITQSSIAPLESR